MTDDLPIFGFEYRHAGKSYTVHIEAPDQEEAHARLDSHTQPSDSARREATHNAITGHHANADKHLTALEHELRQPNANEAKVRQHADAFREEMKKAEESRGQGAKVPQVHP